MLLICVSAICFLSFLLDFVLAIANFIINSTPSLKIHLKFAKIIKI